MRMRETGSSSATRIRALVGAAACGSSGSGEGSVNFMSFSCEIFEALLCSANITVLDMLLQTHRQGPRPSCHEHSQQAQKLMSLCGQRGRIAFLHGLAERPHNLRRVIVKERDQ